VASSEITIFPTEMPRAMISEFFTMVRAEAPRFFVPSSRARV